MRQHARTRLRALMSPKHKRDIVGEMGSRTNQTAAMITDLAVILLPEVGMYEAALMLRRHLIPSLSPFERSHNMMPTRRQCRFRLQDTLIRGVPGRTKVAGGTFINTAAPQRTGHSNTFRDHGYL